MSDTDHTTNAVVAIDRAIAHGEAHLAKLRKARETLVGDASPVVRNKPGRKPKDNKTLDNPLTSQPSPSFLQRPLTESAAE